MRISDWSSDVCSSDLRGVGAFALQVELGGQRALDLGDDLARADLVGARMGAVDEPGNILQQRDVGGDLALDARAQHLDHDFAPWRVALGAPRPGVHLRNRRADERRVGKTWVVMCKL